MPREASAFWVAAPGRGEIRHEVVPDPGPGEVLVRTQYSAISRGTESLVFAGLVPTHEADSMRAPFQSGTFPAPVKYGYLSVGQVEAGAAELLGRTVFCLYPHQTVYVVPAEAVHVVPDGVPAERAVLGGTVETAINALWDAAPRVGDRVAVVGAGMVGCCVARLMVQVPGTRVTLVDVQPGRSRVAAALGVEFAAPDEITGEHEIVVHTSATAAGLQRSLELLAPDRFVLEMSWYGTREVTLTLGGGFHSRRLAIRSSQVGAVARARRAYRSSRERLALALDLLHDPAFDCLLDDQSSFADLPSVLAGLAQRPGLAHLITYPDESTPQPSGRN